jgi:LysM repeat protein
MKRSLIVVLAVLLVASFAYAGMKTYQVTGPVLEVTPTTITVQKGKDKWEIARDNGTKVSGDLKVGSKVTIQYEMKAASIDVKEEKKKGK